MFYTYIGKACQICSYLSVYGIDAKWISIISCGFWPLTYLLHDHDIMSYLLEPIAFQHFCVVSPRQRNILL